MRNLRKTLLPAIAVLVALQVAWPVCARGDTNERVEFHAGFGRTSFLNVNMTDAKAAFKAFTKSVGIKKG